MHRPAVKRRLLTTAAAVSVTAGAVLAAAGPVAAKPVADRQASFGLTTNVLKNAHDTAKSAVGNIR
jgi:hypothetical protein